jgi:hypothetical protein
MYVAEAEVEQEVLQVLLVIEPPVEAEVVPDVSKCNFLPGTYPPQLELPLVLEALVLLLIRTA